MSQSRRTEPTSNRQTCLLTSRLASRESLLFRIRPLHECNNRRSDGQGSDRYRDQQHAQPAAGSCFSRCARAFGLQLAVGTVLRRLEEAPLYGIEVGGMLAGPVERGVEADAAVEVDFGAAGLVPFLSSGGQMRPQPPTLFILLEPVGKARPVCEESLVGHLDGGRVDSD